MTWTLVPFFYLGITSPFNSVIIVECPQNMIFLWLSVPLLYKRQAISDMWKYMSKYQRNEEWAIGPVPVIILVLV